jgi:hypothetical protein
MQRVDEEEYGNTFDSSAIEHSDLPSLLSKRKLLKTSKPFHSSRASPAESWISSAHDGMELFLE